LSDCFTYDDNSLLEKTAAGDEAAFRQLFFRYYNKLGSFVFRLTESYPLTEEIIQDVFLKVWLRRAQLPAIDRFEAYLFTIARNQAFSCLRQLARERVRNRKWAEHNLLQLADEGNGIDFTAIIEAGVQRLSPSQRKVYLLSRYDKLPQKQIAEQMNVSVETVKKHMVLALRTLKTYVLAHIKTLFFFIVACLLK
jgi:RNA polymerase sigma-70 factor (ECF subfamily)